jgi:4-amino-4-deoxy-L-arabinose transferase-like glycosyltransferase
MIAGRWRSSLPLALIVSGYLIISALYATNTPSWQVPDEPAHYNYIAQVAAHGCCPIIAEGDWDNAYLEAIKAARFAPEALAGRLDTVQYEDHQPPLYYLLAAPIFHMSDGNLTALRLFSALLGAGAVIAAWTAARIVFPEQPWLAVGAAGLVAFMPQRVAMMAGVNNDALAELLAGLILIACLWHIRGGGAWTIPAMGVLLGLALITKLTVYPMAGVIAVTILLRARDARAPLRMGLARLAGAFALAALIGLPFWARNVQTYGWPDFLAQAAHDDVVVGQPQTADYIAAQGAGAWLGDAARITFQSFWGQFGWMGVPMTGPIYLALAGFLAVVAGGALAGFIGARRSMRAEQHHALIVLATGVLLTFGAFAYYNLRFVQFQGRYLFPALIPIALCAAYGLAWWARQTGRRMAVSISMIAMAGGMAAFALYALYRIILPGLA